jgi:hypothetical protein
MGWLGDKIGDVFSKVGSFVKRGLKKVGKFFKRAFKKVGKFMGRLGPVGMLGMMLIMPQLGAWWSEFGAWAAELAQPFKFVMESVHWAGAQIGKAYSTITEGIDNLIGGFAETVGLGDKYTDLKSWMDVKLNEARDFVGLETTTPMTTTGLLEDKIPTDADIDYAKIAEEGGRITIGSTTGPAGTAQYSNIALSGETIPLEEITAYGTIPEVSDLSLLTPEAIGGTAMTAAAVKDITEDITKIDKVDASKDWRSDDEKESWGDKARKFYAKYEGGKEILAELGLVGGEEDWELPYQSYVADNYVPLYESANLDWNQQGYQGMPQSGIGNANYLESIMSSFQSNPYYWWMAQQQQQQQAQQAPQRSWSI